MLQFVKTEFIARFDPDHAYLKQGIRTALSTLIALIVYRCEPNWTEGYWIVLAAVFLMQTRVGNNQWQQTLSLLFSGISAAVLAYVAGFFWHQVILLALYLAITTFITSYVALLSNNIFFIGYYINLFALMSSGLVTDTHGQVERFYMILLGSFITFALGFLWPTRVKQQWRRALKIYFLSLAELCDALSKSYLQHQGHRLKIIKFEHRMHERRNRSLRLLNRVRDSYQRINKTPADAKWLEKAEHLFMVVIALGNIRHYEAMTTVEREIGVVFEEIALCLKALSTFSPLDLTNLQRASRALQAESGLIPFKHRLEIVINELGE